MYKKKKKSVNLTPLIDVMTTLIIFILIQSSDSTVEIDEPIDLAQNEYAESVEGKLDSILVGMNEIVIGEDFKLSLKQGNVAAKDLLESETKIISPLYEKISKMREDKIKNKKDLSVNLAFDKSVPSDSVKKVIFTATMAGVDNIYYLGEEK